MNLKDVANWYNKKLTEKGYFQNMALTDKKAIFYFPNLEKSIIIKTTVIFNINPFSIEPLKDTFFILLYDDKKLIYAKGETKKTIVRELLKFTKIYLRR